MDAMIDVLSSVRQRVSPATIPLACLTVQGKCVDQMGVVVCVVSVCRGIIVLMGNALPAVPVGRCLIAMVFVAVVRPWTAKVFAMEAL